jgi:hypothetical protein
VDNEEALTFSDPIDDEREQLQLTQFVPIGRSVPSKFECHGTENTRKEKRMAKKVAKKAKKAVAKKPKKKK